MRYALRYSSAYGDVQDFIVGLEVEDFSNLGFCVVKGRLLLLDGVSYGERYLAVYVNGEKVRHIYVPENRWIGGTPDGQVIELRDSTDPDYGIEIEDCGDWADPLYDPFYFAEEFEATASGSISFHWNAFKGVLADNPTLVMQGTGSGQITNLKLLGLKRFSSTDPVPNRPTFGQLTCVLSDVAGTRTLEIYAGSQLIASGSRAGNGTIILTAQNQSQVSGECTVTYTADATFLATCHWPLGYQLHWSLSPLVFPRTPEAVLEDDGTSNLFRYVTQRLTSAPGLYYCAVLAIGDTNQVPTSTTATGTVTIVAYPASPARFAYLDGDATNTRVRFTAQDNTSTFNIYESDLDAAPGLTTPAYTLAAGIGDRTQALTALGAGVTGIRTLLLKAVSSGGVESQNALQLQIEYENGTVVPGRPNQPVPTGPPTVDGLDFTVNVRYDARGQSAYPAYIQLFLSPVGTPIDWFNPAATVDITALANSQVEIDVEATVLTAGAYIYGLRAMSLALWTDGNENTYPTYFSEAVPTDVGDVEIVVRRS